MSGVPTDELQRQASTKARILAALRDAGARGVTNHEFNDGMGIYRYGARIEELRKAGHVITSIHESGGTWRFVLTIGGYLANLPVTGSISGRPVRPVPPTAPATDGRLF
jgi:hypothetical protein